MKILFQAYNKITKQVELSTNVTIEGNGNVIHHRCPENEESNMINCDCIEIRKVIIEE